MAGFVLAVVYVPLMVIVVHSFSIDRAFAGRRPATPQWWTRAWQRPGPGRCWPRREVARSPRPRCAPARHPAALALARYRFFGQRPLSLVLVLPIALPGIVTGIALDVGLPDTGIGFGIYTIMIAHATFCVVMVYNNVVARLRRMSARPRRRRWTSVRASARPS